MDRTYHTPHDDRCLNDALRAFVRAAAQGDVSVEYAAGVASLRGSVTSFTARAAVEDLVAAHEGVESVVNHLIVESAPTTQVEGVEHRR
jgi:osmotically-inducible protein OsmY